VRGVLLPVTGSGHGHKIISRVGLRYMYLRGLCPSPSLGGTLFLTAMAQQIKITHKYRNAIEH
jgi:hypothetical protein